MVASTVNVAVPVTARSNEVLMSPAPLDSAQAEAGSGTQVHVTAVSPVGIRSVTEAPTTDEGPALDATMRYWMASPGKADSRPSSLVIERSACGDSVSLSVAELLAGLVSVEPDGWVTCAVLTRKPNAAGSMSAMMTTSTDPPTGTVTGDE